jgi:N-dimethylarginine dimethylaminohydrolase
MTGAEVASTLGGPGWRPREGSHRDEVAAGQFWVSCGYRYEFAALRQVMLARPPATLAEITDPAAQLMNSRPDPVALAEQYQAVRHAYACAGVDVVTIDEPTAPPNVIFTRDLCFVTPEGAIVARMASRQRAGEERYAATALAAAGIPILATPAGTATFEGADALWLSPDTVLVGVGRRTNDAGADLVTRVLAAQEVRVIPVPLPSRFQHLLGSVNFVAPGIAAVHPGAPAGLRALLRERGVRLIEMPATPEVVTGYGMNVVALEPGRVLMPGDCPGVRRAFEASGVQADEVAVTEYVRAAGGLGCLTAILRRDG